MEFVIEITLEKILRLFSKEKLYGKFVVFLCSKRMTQESMR
jgi:hypothetical protein